jgi:hypothetical protein
MTTSQIEANARRSAANIGDSPSRTALAVQLADAVALLSGIEAGLHDATPDGLQVACTVEAQLGTALLSLRMVADRIAAGAVHTPATVERPTGDLVDETGPLYAFTADQLAARDEAQCLAGWLAAQNELVQA